MAGRSTLITQCRQWSRLCLSLRPRPADKALTQVERIWELDELQATLDRLRQERNH